MTINVQDATIALKRGGDGIARSFDPDGKFRSQIGRVPVTLHPTQNTTLNEATKVQFGFPFAKGECISASDIRVFAADGTTELPVYAEVTMDWQNWDDNPLKSVRSVSITTETTFADATTPVEIFVEWGTGAPTVTLPEHAFNATWVNYRTSGLQWGNFRNVPAERRPQFDYDGTGEGMPEEVIMEPATWATLPPSYMRVTGVFGYELKLNTNDPWIKQCMQFYQDSAKTMTNEVKDHVTEEWLTPYMTKGQGELGSRIEPSGYASWLFDRASALYLLYGLTGNLKDLIQAHRAAYFYESKLEKGALTLKSFADLKYTYPKALVFDRLMMGNIDITKNLDEIVEFQDSWSHDYEFNAGSTRLWTERHLAYKLGAYRSMWELTGSSALKAKAIEMFEVAFNLQQTPVNGWPKDGSIRHTFNVHEGFAGDNPCASPWMASLLAGEIKLYFESSRDLRALRVLADMGDWITNHGTRMVKMDETENLYSVPWYLACEGFGSSNTKPGFNDYYSDVMHCFDVGSLMAKAVWAKQLLKEDYAADEVTWEKLMVAAAWKFRNFRRGSEGTIAAGGTTVRLQPTRCFNWWFTNGFDVAGIKEGL